MRYFFSFALLLLYGFNFGQLMPGIEKSKDAPDIKIVRPYEIKPGTYISRQDNMSVVVPHLKKLKRIPNGLKRADSLPFIPNGYRSRREVIGNKVLLLQKSW